MPDLGEAYADAQRRMVAIARAHETTLDARVPACPEWSAKDVVAHVTSLASELSAGQMPADLNLVAFWDEDVARRREELVARALDERRSCSLDEIVEEWDRATAAIMPMLRGDAPPPDGAPPMIQWILVTDVGVHLQDLAAALGDATHRDALATGLGLRSYVEAMRFRVAHEGLPALRIRAGSREWIVGEGEPAATVTADPFELSRAASGRRSPEQIRAYAWDGDAEPFLTLFYPYGARADALVE